MRPFIFIIVFSFFQLIQLCHADTSSAQVTSSLVATMRSQLPVDAVLTRVVV
jgi:hypothetical protein